MKGSYTQPISYCKKPKKAFLLSTHFGVAGFNEFAATNNAIEMGPGLLFRRLLLSLKSVCHFFLPFSLALSIPFAAQSQTTIGGVNMGSLTNHLLVFTDGNVNANWQGATKGYIGDVAIDGIQATENTSGSVAFAGTIYTNNSTLENWATIVDQNDPGQVNPAQAFSSTNQTTHITYLEAELASAFTQINALTATTGYTGVLSTSLNGLNTQNSVAEVYVINITSGFSISSKINITGDPGDVFFLRWDTDANFGDGYEGNVKFQGGGAIVPLGGLVASNFIHVAGDLSSSGGGNNPATPYPQGPRSNNGTGTLITNGTDFDGGGFFTGYWLTTGNPATRNTSSFSNLIIVGGWYSSTNKFSMTGGTSGVYVSPNVATMLPVELLEFSAIRNGQNVLLKWISATETNNDYFEIQRADQGKNFETIGMVKGAGNTNAQTSYSFTDKVPYSGVNFYRLRQVDFDSHGALSPIRNVNFNTSPGISIFPNPTTNELSLSLNEWSPEHKTVLNVFDLNGAEVLTEEIISSITQLNVTHLPVGTYFIRVANSTTTEVHRFIKL